MAVRGGAMEVREGDHDGLGGGTTVVGEGGPWQSGRGTTVVREGGYGGQRGRPWRSGSGDHGGQGGRATAVGKGSHGGQRGGLWWSGRGDHGSQRGGATEVREGAHGGPGVGPSRRSSTVQTQTSRERNRGWEYQPLASWCTRTLSGHHPPQAPRQGWFLSVPGPQDLCESIRSLGTLEKPRSQPCHFVGGPLAWPGSLLEMPIRDGGVPHPGDENLQLTKVLRGLEYTPHCEKSCANALGRIIQTR